ncbi:glycosyltransferase [Candidatus Fermentibacteria bacterium]|nr:glycosyltransferase [Candidatus Fermentibacteria bacterium]
MQHVSVVIPVYNRCDLLRRTLLSLASQSLAPCEIIVSDDGSDEDIWATLMGCVPLLNCSLAYVRQPRKGFRAARTRNNGIHYASHDILVFVDQDIVTTRGYLARLAQGTGPGTFAVGYPIRLTQRQTACVTDAMIRQGRFGGVVTAQQRGKVTRQFVKDFFYHHARRHGLMRAARPKLRSGVFGAWREDILRVDGFDENFEGWGNEDDDLGRRLYASGVRGRNVCFREFPLHLYHVPHHNGGFRANQAFAQERIPRILSGEVRASRGLSSTTPEERPNATWLR